MSVRHLELADFRIFRAVSVDLEREGTTVITGSNGTGKTSVLEAVAYLGTRRSFRGAPPDALVRAGAVEEAGDTTRWPLPPGSVPGYPSTQASDDANPGPLRRKWGSS